MERMLKTYLIIPAYEPDEKLICLLQDVSSRSDYEIILVDDGSGAQYEPLFHTAQQYAHLLRHPANMGKGCALKTAMRYIRDSGTECSIIITADSDGQHTADDIKTVREAAAQHRKSLVLGERHFTGRVPFKSRAGNRITSLVFHLAAGEKISDTQTGLRAFSGAYLHYMISVEGNRYEYETNVLLKWAGDRLPFYEQPIETIYLDENASSHFHPVRDSFLIYKEILKFTFSSFLSFLLDYGLYSLLIAMTGTLPLNISVGISNVAARCLSGAFNYTLNRRFVFKSKENVARTATQYMMLAASILVLNTLLLTLLVNTVVPNRYLAKILVEMFLFLFSITVQKRFIFRRNKKDAESSEYRKAVMAK